MSAVDRWSSRRRWTLSAVAVLAMSLVASATAAPPPTPPTPAPTPVSSGETVTLITGDQVTLAGNDVTYHHREGREDITFVGQRVGDDYFVVPSDALPLLRDGRLDKRLFNVSMLQRIGYDDRTELPLIITTEGFGTASAQSALQDADVTVIADLPAVRGTAVELSTGDADDFWDGLTTTTGDGPATMSAGISKVWLDGMRQPLLDESVAQVGAPTAWEQGLDGSGATVAVLDTGIDQAHPDLSDRIIGRQNFTEGVEDDRDRVGHGTHVASIIAGSGTASDGQFRGVAPGVHLLDGKVCVAMGCQDSWILAGMQWAAEQDADVINMSLGGPDTPDTDLLELGVNTLTEQFDVLFVTAAGNDGRSGDGTVNSPASADAALAVGSVDKGDHLAGDSSRGPRLDGALKPDMTAPGVAITAARSADGVFGTPGEDYTTLSGTSMATPHVTGAAAILVQQHPDWPASQLKTALMNSAVPHAEAGPFAQGAGRLDIARAIEQTLTTSPASVSFDRQPWPHDDDDPETQTVTYRNGNDTEVTVDLSMTVSGPTGGSVPEGFFTLSEETLTVPANGAATVSITSDATTAGVDGFYGGHLTATGPGVSATTPFAVHQEGPRFDVTVQHLDRTGAPTTNYATTLIRKEDHAFIDVLGPSTTSVRVQPGEYILMSTVHEDTADDGTSPVTLLVQPSVQVDEDQTIIVDAREGEAVSVSMPNAEAAPVQAWVQSGQVTQGGSIFSWILRDSFEGLFTAQVGPDQVVDGYSSAVLGTWARPNPAGGFTGSPYSYHGAWFGDGRMLEGLERDVQRGDLAVVEADHAVHFPGALGSKATFGYLPGVSDSGVGVSWLEPLPFTRTEYHTIEGGVHWGKKLAERVLAGDPEFPFYLAMATATGERIHYDRGRVRETWNRGVFGPVLPHTASNPSVDRTGNRMVISPSVYGDGAGRAQSGAVNGLVEVFRNDELIAEVPSMFAPVTVPSEAADYRLEIHATRDERFPLSTETSLTWTFRSGRVDGDTTVPLPVAAVRFAPRLDEHNTAPAGRTFRFPVEVQPQIASDWGEVRDLTVEVSYDDGQTWQVAPIDGQGHVRVTHPRQDGFVSLRAQVTSTHGNTTEQTVIRAYRITSSH